ncbi:MAG TPA: GxxExxY protein [Acetobacteraceae bacterium]|nr:GxxExxY protein [Acetobacteraceae bacterium]
MQRFVRDEPYVIRQAHEDLQAHKEEYGSIPEDRTNCIIGLAIKIHRKLGPGLLEEVYEECLCWELEQNGLTFARQVPVPLVYEGIRLPRGYRADVVVEDAVIIEIKSIEHILPVHTAQMLTYLRLSGCRIGLPMNFNTKLLKDGLHRFVL